MALIGGSPQASRQRPDLPASTGSSALFTLAMIVIAVVALYFGRDIFIPLALAMLLSFALAPPVRRLRRMRLPNLPAVLSVVTVAFLIILSFGWIVAWQAADLAEELPVYRANVEAKIDSLRESPPGGRLIERATDMVRDFGRRIAREERATSEEAGVSTADEAPAPIPVEIHQPAPTSMQIITTIVGPLISPLATAGIVIVFVIFMLLKREDLRDRLIRLAGPRDLPRTTQALDDAASRVGRYLLMQLVVNTTYAIPIGIGLWLIGIPNPVLWAMLCAVLRFVPYIGPIVAAFFPLALAVAVDPGWTMLLLVGALFVLIELLSNNFIEPWLYGASTGLSPIAVIAAAVFWTWLWGPIGLLLSTPLTVCLVVLGRHVPQFAFLDVLLGNEPVLTLPELIYQRMLMGDPNDATERAEEYLRSNSLTGFYDDVAIPALALAEDDRAQGLLSEDQLDRIIDSAAILIDNLSEWEETAAAGAAGEEHAAKVPPTALAAAEHIEPGRLIICAAARSELDEAAAAMLAQLVERRGGTVRVFPYGALQTTTGLAHADLGDAAAVVLSTMNSDSLAPARFLIRRLRRRLPNAIFIAGFWTFPNEERSRRDPVKATGADHVVTTLEEAVETLEGVVAPPAAEDGTASNSRVGRLSAVGTMATSPTS